MTDTFKAKIDEYITNIAYFFDFSSIFTKMPKIAQLGFFLKHAQNIRVVCENVRKLRRKGLHDLEKPIVCNFPANCRDN